jgi:hypothetical protein
MVRRVKRSVREAPRPKSKYRSAAVILRQRGALGKHVCRYENGKKLMLKRKPYICIPFHGVL